MRIHVVKYVEDGKEKERGFRDKRQAEKLKKVKRGSIRPLEVELKVLISAGI